MTTQRPGISIRVAEGDDDIVAHLDIARNKSSYLKGLVRHSMGSCLASWGKLREGRGAEEVAALVLARLQPSDEGISDLATLRSDELPLVLTIAAEASRLGLESDPRPLLDWLEAQEVSHG